MRGCSLMGVPSRSRAQLKSWEDPFHLQVQYPVLAIVICITV
jgi:hypothetical protein